MDYGIAKCSKWDNTQNRENGGSYACLKGYGGSDIICKGNGIFYIKHALCWIVQLVPMSKFVIPVILPKIFKLILWKTIAFAR
jgi:hypothetical protein